MTEYYEEGGLLYEQSPPMHIKVESPEGPFGGGASENGFPREDDDSEGSCDQNSGLPGGLPFNVVVVHPNIMAPGMSSDDLLSIEQSKPERLRPLWEAGSTYFLFICKLQNMWILIEVLYV